MDSKDIKNSDQNPAPSAWQIARAAKKEAANEAKKIVKKEGRVIEALPNAFFKVVLDDGKEVRGFLSGKMRLNRIKILPGDKVTLEMTEYDLDKGRIVYRLK